MRRVKKNDKNNDFYLMPKILFEGKNKVLSNDDRIKLTLQFNKKLEAK